MKFDIYIPPPGQFDTYTPLNASIEQIMHAIGNEKYVNKPWLAKSKPNADGANDVITIVTSDTQCKNVKSSQTR